MSLFAADRSGLLQQNLPVADACGGQRVPSNDSNIAAQAVRCGSLKPQAFSGFVPICLDSRRIDPATVKASLKI
jgi:hypothetical protein